MVKWKKLMSLIIGGTMLFGTMIGCSSDNSKSNSNGSSQESTAESTKENVKITFLNSKGEIQTQLEDVAKKYQDATGNVEIEIVPCSAGNSPFETLTALYAGGNAPTISLVDQADVESFKDKLLDLSGEKWEDDAIDGALDSGKIDGKSYVFPFAVEGYALIYNKKVLDEAGVDPSTINTRTKLEDAFKKVEGTGKSGVVITSEDWSLAAHLLATAYSDKGTNTEDVQAFLDAMRDDAVDLKEDTVLNGFLDTFDMMKNYNINKKDPLSATYDTNPMALGESDVGFWFMGNWAWPQIEEFAEGNEEFGFIPVPISDNESDFGNNEIPACVSKVAFIDESQSSEAQQQAAKDFLNWLVYDAEGQRSFVEGLNLIVPFKNIDIEIADPLGKSVQEYLAEGKTSPVIATLPSKHWEVLGASMQKYLVGNIDRDALLKEISDYWKSTK